MNQAFPAILLCGAESLCLCARLLRWETLPLLLPRCIQFRMLNILCQASRILGIAVAAEVNIRSSGILGGFRFCGMSLKPSSFCTLIHIRSLSI